MFGDIEVDDAEERVVSEPTDLKFVGPATAEVLAAADFDAQAVVDKEVSYRMLVDAGVNPGVAAKIRRWHSLSWSFESGDGLDRRSEQVRGLQDGERDWVASSYGGEETDDLSDATDDRVETDTSEAEWVAESVSDEGGDDAQREGGAADSEWAAADTEVSEAEWIAAAVGDDEEETLVDDSDSASPSRAEARDAFSAEASWVAASPLAGDEGDASADGSGDPLAAEAAWQARSQPTPLTELSGIGEAYADRLAEAGVTSVRSLATADPELLSDATGLPESRVRDWYEQASELAD